MENLIEQPINKEIFRHYWYSQNVCLYEIIKLAQHKEMVFLDKKHEMMPVRCMFPFKVDHLKADKTGLFSVYRFFNSFSYNMYLSCAYFDNPPLFSFIAKERREQMDRWSKEEQYKNYWTGYDMFFDFDSQQEDDIGDAWQDAAKLKAVLDQYHVPFTIGFSVAGETPLLVKIDGKIQLIPIKKAIDFFKSKSKIEVLALNNKKINWSPVYNYLEHFEQLYEIHHKLSKIPIKTTQDHSVYILDENLKIKPQKVGNLKPGVDLCFRPDPPMRRFLP